MVFDDAAMFRIYFPKAKPTDLNEEFLINNLTAKGKYKAGAATMLLRQCGTIASVNALKACCLRPIQDLQITAIFTLQVILGPAVAEFALSLLNEKQYSQKWAAMLVACETCGAQHRDALETRLKQAVSRQRACAEIGALSGKTTEVLHFLSYLERTKQNLGSLGTYLLRKQEHLTSEELLEVSRIVQIEQLKL